MTVGGITTQSSNGFSTWTADVPLSLGLNTISVTATNGNIAATTPVDKEVQIIREEYTLGNSDYITHDMAKNRVLLTADPLFIDAGIMAIDLSTGAQSVRSAASPTNTENYFHYPQSVTIDTTRKRAFIL